LRPRCSTWRGPAGGVRDDSPSRTAAPTTRVREVPGRGTCRAARDHAQRSAPAAASRSRRAAAKQPSPEDVLSSRHPQASTRPQVQTHVPSCMSLTVITRVATATSGERRQRNPASLPSPNRNVTRQPTTTSAVRGGASLVSPSRVPRCRPSQRTRAHYCCPLGDEEFTVAALVAVIEADVEFANKAIAASAPIRQATRRP
jgi:hypothetical protein